MINELKENEKTQVARERIQKRVNMILKIMDVKHMPLDDVLLELYEDKSERIKIKDEVENTLKRIERCKQIIHEKGRAIYWTMNGGSVKVGDESITSKGWHKKKDSYDNFFEKLGFVSESEKDLFYNDKKCKGNGRVLELRLLPLATNEDLFENVEQNIKRMLFFVEAVDEISSGGHECSYDFIIELFDHLFKVARKSYKDRSEVYTIIRDRVMEFYYKYATDCEKGLNELLVRLALIVDYNMDKEKTEDDKARYINSYKLIRFLREIERTYPEAIQIFQRDFLYEQDILMEQIRDVWDDALEKSMEDGNLRLDKLKECIISGYK